MRSVLHTTPHTYSDFSPARSDSTSACVREGARTGSFFQHTLGFIRAIAGQKLHLQFFCAIPLFTFTRDSGVMSTICQSPRACRDDFQHYCQVEWTDIGIGASNQLGMSPPFVGTKSRQDRTSKRKETQTHNFQLHALD